MDHLRCITHLSVFSMAFNVTLQNNVIEGSKSNGIAEQWNAIES